jgi:hypothetical protein
MPVELPPEKSDEREPSLPNLIVWLVMLVITMGVGAALTLKMWPTGEPTTTARFWIDLFLKPFLVWTGMFGLRTLYYGQARARIDAEDAARAVDRREGIRFASEPLAVLGYAYLTAVGTNNVSALVRQRDEKNESSAGDGIVSGDAGSLGLAGDDEDPTRYRACFRELISLIAESVRAIPASVPFSVRLHGPASVDSGVLADNWRVAWDAAKLRPANVSLVASDRGVMELDEWLDIRGGPRLEQCVLYVAASLRDVPASQGAEAASAILLGWAPLARRHAVRLVAQLHRPVEGSMQNFESGITSALMWGKTTVNAVKDVWLAGFQGEEKVAISKCLRQTPLDRSDAAHSELRDLTAFFGDVGGASSWLAMALGIESAAQTHRPQLVACRERAFRFAVIQPDGKRTESGGC